MKTCLVTGSNGLVGSFLLKELEGEPVYVLAKNSHPSLNSIAGDLTDEAFPSKLPKKIDAVIHLAQSNHFKDFPEKSLDIFSVNTMSTLRLLDYARQAGAKMFIYASSGVVYGTGPHPFLESSQLPVQSRLGLYYTSKQASEMLVENYSNFFHTVILRFFFVYGPHQKGNMLIPRLVQSVSEGKPIQLQGETGIRINPIYAADAARAVKAALSLSQSEKINVAGPEILNLKDIGEVIGQCLGKEPHFDYNLQASPQDLIGDTQKMKTLLSAPSISFKKGIASYLDSLQALKC